MVFVIFIVTQGKAHLFQKYLQHKQLAQNEKCTVKIMFSSEQEMRSVVVPDKRIATQWIVGIELYVDGN